MNELTGIVEKRQRVNGHTRVHEFRYSGKLGDDGKVEFTRCLCHSYILIACENEQVFSEVA